MLQKFAMVKYGVFVAKICKHALCASTVRDIWWSPLARQLLPPWLTTIQPRTCKPILGHRCVVIISLPIKNMRLFPRSRQAMEY